MDLCSCSCNPLGQKASRLGREAAQITFEGASSFMHAEYCERSESSQLKSQLEGIDRLLTSDRGLHRLPLCLSENKSYRRLPLPQCVSTLPASAGLY